LTTASLTELSLFSGVGGGLLASKHLLGWKTLGYVEINEYCQKVIAQRIKDGLLDEAPIFTDIKAFNRDGYAESYQGMVDVVSGGFPCQPFSVAGKQLNEKDDRNMWPETAITIQTIRPKFILLENVPGVSSYLPVVIRDLRRLGYTVEPPEVIAAAAVGAGHIRRRVWIYAHNDQAGLKNAEGQSATEKRGKIGRSTRMENSQALSPDINQVRKLQQERRIKNERERACDCCWWETEPDVVRVVYGVPNGMDRLAALGNAQVPLVAATAWKILN